MNVIHSGWISSSGKANNGYECKDYLLVPMI